MLALLAGLLAGAVSAQDARPLRGVALVIGNSAYEHIPALTNPANDARAVESLLDGLGFETSLSSDRDARRLARDLRDFVEDAEGADVAILYYAGHGIEAGGENFLVPVDADLSALDAAGEKLVPLSAFVERLQAVVPVTIVMLDACRDNPFPAGSLVRLDTSSAAVSMGEAGLGETRGAARLSAPRSGVESYGAVLAFAAEPGRAALDGEAGGNSPYAAALLRHLDAMAGEEFGMVMRMVGEEVYLKTSGAQRPWVNESLRRLLYFGGAADPVEGNEGDILTERRQLLVTIAALPDPERRRIEKVAQEGGVPMDVVYGMLRALGQDTPEDPAQLEELLREQTQRVAELFSRDEALGRSDPELQRLSDLTDDALAEGAIETAARLRQEVDRRIAELDAVVDDAEAQVKARRMEFAVEYVRSARIAVARFDLLAAADYYALAFEQAERWDDDFAMRARNSEVDALRVHAGTRGDPAALVRGIGRGREAIAISQRAGGPDAAAAARVSLALLLAQQQSVTGDVRLLEEAIAEVDAALEVHTRERAASLWVVTYHALGQMLQARGVATTDPGDLERAERVYRELIAAPALRDNPSLWAKAHANIAGALNQRTRLTGDTALLQAAYDFAAAGAAGTDRDQLPADWAVLHQAVGDVTLEAARRGAEAASEISAISVSAYRAALGVFTRERYPAVWADTTARLAEASFLHGQLLGDAAVMREAVALIRAVGATISSEDRPADWAMNQARAGSFLYSLYENTADTGALRDASSAYSAALSALGSDASPAQRLAVAATLADTLIALANVEIDIGRIEKAIAVLRETLSGAGEVAAVDAAFAKAVLGKALLYRGNHYRNADAVDEAVSAYAEAMAGIVRVWTPVLWSNTRMEQAKALALQGGHRKREASYLEAAAIALELLADPAPSSAPEERVGTQNFMANVLREAAYLSGKPETLKRAVDAYRGVLDMAPSMHPLQRAEVQEQLAQVTVDLGVALGDSAIVTDGRSLLASAAETLRHAGEAARAEQMATMLARVDAWLAANE